jgi:RNA polymerase sigma factor (sigma-70 family)
MAPTQLHTLLEHMRQLLVAGHVADLDDGQLLQLFARTRDEQAFVALVQRHGPLVHSVCRRVLGAGPDLDDVFQATFLVLARKARSIRKLASVGSWLHGVALRLAVHLKGQRGRRREGSLDGTAVPDEDRGGDPVARAALKEMAAVLDEEVQRLPARYRDAVLLCHLEGLSTAEAAARLGCPTGTLKCRLVKARELLRGRLARRGLGLSVTALTVLAAESAAAGASPELLRTAAVAGAACPPPTATRAALLAQRLLRPSPLTRPALLAALVVLAAVGLGWAFRPDPAPPAAAQTAATEQAAARDRRGDALPAGARQRLGTTRWRHGGVTGFVAFLPGGQRVLSAADDGLFRLWEYPSDKEIRQFGPALAADRRHPVNFGESGLPAAVTPDGKVVACYFEGGNIRLYDVATGKELHRFKDTTNRLGQTANGALAFCPAGRLLAVRQFDGSIRVWDWAVAREVGHFNLPPPDGGIGGGNARLTFTPDGKMLTGLVLELADGKIRYRFRMWDPQSGKVVQTLSLGDGLPNLSPPVFSPDGKTLVFDAFDGTIRLLDTRTGQEIRRFAVDLGSGEHAMSFSGDGATLFTRAFSRVEVDVWDVATGKSLRRLGPGGVWDPFRNFYHQYIAAPALTPGGDVLAVAGLDHGLHFLSVAGDKQEACPVAGPVQWLQYSPDGKELWTQAGSTHIQRWDPATGKEVGEVAVGTRPFDVLLSPDGKVAVAHRGGDTPIKVFNAADGTELASIPRQPADDYPSFAFAGKVLVARWPLGEKITLHELPSGKVLQAIAVVTGEPERRAGQPSPGVAPPLLIVSGEGARPLLAAYSDAGTVAVWDIATGKKVASLPVGSGGPAPSGALSPDGRCLALDREDGTVVVWELATGRKRCVFGKKLPAGGPQERRVGAGGLTWPVGPRVAFSPDGRLLAHAGSDRVIHIWALTSGAEVAHLAGHRGAVNAIAFAPGGQTLASGSSDTTVLLWDPSGLRP